MRTVRSSTRLAAAFGGVLGALLLGGARPAHAHFLWAEVTPGPEATFRLSFGETAGEATLPALLPRIEAARATLPDGKPLTLKRGDGALVTTLPAGVKAAGASQRWGVLDKTAEGRGIFMLQYFAKGAQDAAAAGERSRVHFEILARQEGGTWVATVMHGSRPEKGAELTILAPGSERPVELKTDEKGEARFSARGSGRCAIRAMALENEAGEFEGKSYSIKRYYSTLTFPIAAAAASGAARVDADAVRILDEAHAARANWRPAFPGFTADAVYSLNGRTARGTVTVGKDFNVTYELGDPELEGVLRPSFGSLIMHRQGGGAPKYQASWRDSESHPLGRAIDLNDQWGSFYRVRDRQILQVNRKMGAQRFTNHVLENEETKHGFLPRAWSVAYYDNESNRLVRVSTTRVTWTWKGDVFLPATMETMNAHGEGTDASLLVLSNHRLLK